MIDELYHDLVIDSGQLVNGLWMGTVLIVLGLIPNSLDRLAQGLLAQGLSAFQKPGWVRESGRPRAFVEIEQPRWLTAAGATIITLSLAAFLTH